MSIIIAQETMRILLRELCKNPSRRDMFRLQSTVGQEATRADKAYELATEAEMQEIATSWSNFHREIAHDSYATLHSKMKFCQSDFVEQLLDDQFMQLIADQKFLFFHYSESTNCPSFPTFRTIIEAKNQYFDIPKLRERLNSTESITSEDLASLITISDVHVAKEADVQKKFEYGLLGSTATWDDYRAGKAKLVYLQEAIAQRRENLKQRPVNKSDYFNREPISIPRYDQAAGKQQFTLNEKDSDTVNQLCAVFVQYISNKPNYTDALTQPLKEHAPKNLTVNHPQIMWLYSELNSKGNELSHHIAIYFYHLFVKYTLKLSKGTAIKYVLKPTETKKKQYLKSSEQVQRNTQNIIQRNLVLWGHLMTLFSPSAKSRLQANMEFWALTRYDHYMHCSKVPREYHMRLDRYPFVYTADYANPVDALGYALRRNIEHCIPCELNQMVIPLPFADTGRGLTILDLLVQDAFSTPAYNRLADRIRRNVDENILELAEEYQSKESTGEVSVYLESYCKEHGLYFDLTYTYHEIKIRDNLLGTYNNETSSLMERFYKSYPQILVEHRINTYLLQPAKRTLYHKAKHVFGDLLFEDTILNPWKAPKL